MTRHRKQTANASSPARDFVIACSVVGLWIAVMNALVIFGEWVRLGR